MFFISLPAKNSLKKYVYLTDQLEFPDEGENLLPFATWNKAIEKRSVQENKPFVIAKAMLEKRRWKIQTYYICFKYDIYEINSTLFKKIKKQNVSLQKVIDYIKSNPSTSKIPQLKNPFTGWVERLLASSLFLVLISACITPFFFIAYFEESTLVENTSQIPELSSANSAKIGDYVFITGKVSAEKVQTTTKNTKQNIYTWDIALKDNSADYVKYTITDNHRHFKTLFAEGKQVAADTASSLVYGKFPTYKSKELVGLKGKIKQIDTSENKKIIMIDGDIEAIAIQDAITSSLTYGSVFLISTSACIFLYIKRSRKEQKIVDEINMNWGFKPEAYSTQKR